MKKVALAFSVFMVSAALIGACVIAPREAEEPAPFSELESRVDSYARNHTWKLLVISETGYPAGNGTAFVARVTNKVGQLVDVVVTARHVCQMSEGGKKNLVLSRGPVYFPTKVIAESDVTDLCFLEAAYLAYDKAYELDTSIHYQKSFVAFGFPQTVDISRAIVKGETTMTLLDISEIPMLLFRGLVYPGQSGGPIVDPKNNKVVAVVTFQMLQAGKSGGVAAQTVLDEAAKLVP